MGNGSICTAALCVTVTERPLFQPEHWWGVLVITHRKELSWKRIKTLPPRSA